MRFNTAPSPQPSFCFVVAMNLSIAAVPVTEARGIIDDPASDLRQCCQVAATSRSGEGHDPLAPGGSPERRLHRYSWARHVVLVKVFCACRVAAVVIAGPAAVAADGARRVR